MNLEHKTPKNIKYYIEVTCCVCNKKRNIYKHSSNRNNICKSCSRKKTNLKNGKMPAIVDNKLSCSTCKTYKNPDEFYGNKKFTYRMSKSLHCKECDHKRTELKRKSKKIYSLKQFYISCKSNKKDFNLRYEDYEKMYKEQQGKCAITGENLTFILNKNKVLTNISIDRIDPKKGYVVDNVHFVCYIVNIMKNVLTLEELKNWCKKILCPNQH